MPQIGWLEILSVVIIAILVLGPKEFPVALKKIGSYVGKLKKVFTNIIISQEEFDEIIKNASIKFITQDSINMVYESLSCKGKTILFNMD